MTDRRPSIVERRPPALATRRPSVIPTLQGIEKPNLSDILPKDIDCDVLIVGTGLSESILAAALSWQGSNVIHIDSNSYYGDSSATLTIEQLKDWCNNSKTQKCGFKNYEIIDFNIEQGQKMNSRDYGIDLSPKILFAKSPLLDVLIKSRVYHYLEFQSLSNFHTFENNSLGKIVSSKEDIFTDDSLNLLAKRKLMKFLKFVIDEDFLSNLTEEEKSSSLLEFLSTRFKLEPKFTNELIFTLGLINDKGIDVLRGLAKIRRYLLSMNIYGNFPALYSKYGGAGELSQGFCRSAAVAGTTYKLNTQLIDFDDDKKIAKLDDGSIFKVNEKLVLSMNQNNLNLGVDIQTSKISRMVVIVNKSCEEWFNDGESSAVVIFPPHSLDENEYPIECLIMGSQSGCCPANQCIWYLQTISSDRSFEDLDNAYEKLEESILRESNFNYDNFNEEDFNDATQTLNENGSLKLNETLKNFKINEKLSILLKLKFNQLVNLQNYEKINDHLIISNMPSSDLSYDDIIDDVKKIYAEIVGDDVDFFDVDFEDEEEELEMNEYNNNLAMQVSEEAIIDDESDRA